LARGPDYRLHFTPEGAPSKLAWAGIFVAAERIHVRRDGPSLSKHVHSLLREITLAHLGAIGRFFMLTERFRLR
jgi:hypothetical protein